MFSVGLMTTGSDIVTAGSAKLSPIESDASTRGCPKAGVSVDCWVRWLSSGFMRVWIAESVQLSGSSAATA